MQFKDISGDLVVAIPVAGQGTAGTADEFCTFVAPFNLKITGVKWVPAAAVTADGSNYFALNLRNRKADASGTALAASRSYVATNSVAFVAEAMTLGAAADLLVNAGDVLTASKVNTGTGLIMPDGLVQIHYQVR